MHVALVDKNISLSVDKSLPQQRRIRSVQVRCQTMTWAATFSARLGLSPAARSTTPLWPSMP